MEDGTDAQEETPEDGPQLGDQVILHHFTELRVVAGSVGLELERREKLIFSQRKYIRYLKSICIQNMCTEKNVWDVWQCSEVTEFTAGSEMDLSGGHLRQLNHAITSKQINTICQDFPKIHSRSCIR